MNLLTIASAEEQHPRYLCIQRSNNPEFGTPIYRQKGGKGGIQHRLKNGHSVQVYRTMDRWSFVQYADPSEASRVRTEPLRFTGWVRNIYLEPCSPSQVLSQRCDLKKVR